MPRHTSPGDAAEAFSQYPLAIQTAPRGLQSIIAALLDNVEKALGCKPVRIGKEGLETFVYRGGEHALKLAGNEIGMFTEKSEISHRRSRYDDLSDADIVRQIRDEAQMLLEHRERDKPEAGEGDGVIDS